MDISLCVAAAAAATARKDRNFTAADFSTLTDDQIGLLQCVYA